MDVPFHLVDSLAPPRPSQIVYREECTLCFDHQDMPYGIDVCLHCFNGACPVESTNRHGLLHSQKSGHVLAVNIKRIKKPVVPSKRGSDEPPIKKLAIREDAPEHEKYKFVTSPRMYFGDTSVEISSNGELDEVIASVLASMSSAQRSEVKAWEEEIVPCVHTRELVQSTPNTLKPSGLATCAHEGCGLTANSWLCLACGSLGCGRQQFGGGGGNGHGLAHTQETGHPVAVKMGTIEPDGSADVYCYACDDARLDPGLAKHLANFGIEVLSQTKTEKTMTELQVEHNLKFDFAMTGADGIELQPLCGPGLTGLRNLGNSCYMASSLQTLFCLPTFQKRYLTSFHTHVASCSQPNPAECFECQMSKIADGLLSGRYAVPRQLDDDAGVGFENTSSVSATSGPSSSSPIFQEGIRPSMFKALVGKGHAEFSTMKQQDAGELLAYLLESARRSARTTGSEDPTSIFGFALEERLQCSECEGVLYKTTNEELLPISVPVTVRNATRGPAAASEGASSTATATAIADTYEPVNLADCFEKLTSAIEVEYRCPRCEKTVSATKSTAFATYPDVLLVNAARFQFDNWVPRKVDVPLVVPHDVLNLDAYQGKGKQDNEVELPEPAQAAVAEPEPTFAPEALGQLTAMGFPENRCKRALLATGNGGADEAIGWLFEHTDDSTLDDPLVASSISAAIGEPSAEDVAPLVEMGFTAAQGRKALRETGNDAARAVEWLFSHPDDAGEPKSSDATGGTAAPTPQRVPGSATLPANYRLKAFVSHKGPSVHSGHYVAHVHMASDVGWVLFNDEKVVRADVGAQSAHALSPLAYVYIFERV